MKTRLFVLFCAYAALSACGDNGTKTSGSNTADTVAATPPPQVALVPVGSSPQFQNATLSMTARSEHLGKDSAKVNFAFTVKDFDLKAQTPDNATKNCSNSKDGQHIHFILDNKPYKALYEPANTVTLPADDQEHYLLAFLSRSYHESVKSPGAALVYHFKIDKSGNLKKLEDPKEPMLFYSRPKGDYLGADTANLLLDFYLWNCGLGDDSFKVKADISNLDKPTQMLSTTITKWEPSFINNLGTGKCKVTLSLVDKTGNAVGNGMNTISREFNMAAAEPMKN